MAAALRWLWLLLLFFMVPGVVVVDDGDVFFVVYFRPLSPLLVYSLVSPRATFSVVVPSMPGSGIPVLSNSCALSPDH